MKPYVPVNTTTRETQELNNNLIRTFTSISKNPLLNSPVLVQGIVLSTSDTIVQHKLGRQYVGFIITNSNAGQTVYQSSTVNSAPGVQIILKATGAVTVDILFF